MTHLHDVNDLQNVAKSRENRKKWMRQVLTNALEKVDNDEALAVGVVMELRESRTFTDFSGGFNTGLLGAIEWLKHRILTLPDGE